MRRVWQTVTGLKSVAHHAGSHVPLALLPTFHSVKVNARLAALVLGGVLLILALGKYRRLERAIFSSDRAEHFGLLYILSCLVLLGFPTRRRSDLVSALLLFALMLACIHGAVQRKFEILSIVAYLGGPAAAYLPTLLESWRAKMRNQPHEHAFRPSSKERRSRRGPSRA